MTFSCTPAPFAAPSLLGRLFKSLGRPLAALALSTAAVTSFAASPAPMKLGAVVWIGYGPFYVAESQDFFKKHKLKVSLQVFSDPALIPSGLASGALDGAMLTYDQVVAQVAAGKPYRVVMPIDYSNGGDAIVATRGITRLSELKGRKIGFNPLSPSDFLLSYALKTAGLGEKDITPVSMTPEAVPAAMASGQMPIGVTYEPSLSQVLGQDGGRKFHVLFSSKDAPGLIADVLVFDEKVIKARPDDIKALIQAYLDGLAFMKARPEQAAKIIGKAMGIPPEEVKEQLAGVHNLTLAEMPQAFVKAKETTSYHASGAVIAELLKAKRQIATIPPAESTIAPQFVNALAAK